MEIKHRKQFSTGKMIAQVRTDKQSPWQDANMDQIIMGLYQQWQRGFEEGCAKGREHSNVVASQEIETLKAANKKLELQLFSMRMDALDVVNPDPLRRTQEMLRERLNDPGSEVSKGIVKAFGLTGLDGAKKTVDRMCSRPLTGNDFSTGGIASSRQEVPIMARDEFVVPHHGIGLLQAEDALRETE